MSKRLSSAVLSISGLLLFAACSAGGEAPTSSDSAEIIQKPVAASPQLAAARSLVGHYTGGSTVYGINAAGEIEKKYSFTEDITATDPQVKDGLAFVNVVDLISGVPFPIKWTEGFHLDARGSIGARYFLPEMPGAVETVEKDLAEAGSATFETDLRPNEEAELGFGGRDILYKKHTTIKNVVTSGNSETHVITRLTTITWKDAAGAIQTKTFVSMNGTQERKL